MKAPLFCLLLIGTIQASAQFVYEPFDYTPGQMLTSQNPAWILNGTTTNDTRIAPGSLEYPGLVSSLGNSITNGGVGAAVRVPIGTAINSGTVYYSFVMRIPQVGNTFDSTTSFIASFVDLASNQQQCRLAVIKAEGGYQLGVTKVSSTEGVFAPTTYTEEETLFIVGSYTFNAGSTTDDQSLLWINPSPVNFGADSPPSPTLTAVLTGNDIAKIDHFAFRQNTAANTPAIIQYDELRIGTTWASVTPKGVLPPPPLIITEIAKAEGEVLLTFETQRPLREHRIEQTTSLGSPAWTDVPNVTVQPLSSNAFKAQFAAPSTPHFYRAINYPLPPVLHEDFEGADTWTHGGTGDSWERGTPSSVKLFNESLLLQDFVFPNETAGTGGLDVQIQGLQPNQSYEITLWSFDSGSTGNRVSDWSANGTLVKSGYTFNGAQLPGSNVQYQFTFEATADNSGAILIAGRRNPASTTSGGAASLGVFLNALQVKAEITPHVPVLSLDFNKRTDNTTANTHEGFASFAIAAAGSATTAQSEPTVRQFGDLTVTVSATEALTYDDRKRVTPVNVGVIAAHSGTNAWATGLNQPYQDNTQQWLRSPVVDLTQATVARLEFWEYRDVEPLFSGFAVDYTSVRIKDATNVEGAPIVELAKDAGSQTGWTKRSFDLGPEVLGKSVVIEFFLFTDEYQPEPQSGWFIDDISITVE